MYEVRSSFDVAPRVRYPVQTKSFSFHGTGIRSFLEHLILQDQHDLTAHMALQFFKTTAPLFNAIDIITEEVAAITPIIWDRKEEVPLKQSAVLDLINNPNPLTNGSEFLKEMASYFLITGNNFLVGTGNVSRPPVEIANTSPTRVTGDSNKQDGFIQQYHVESAVGRFAFNRIEEKRMFRFIHGDDKELWHSKTFNPNQNHNHFFGLSKLMPIFREIEQYNESSIHNLALLKNGATVKGVLSVEGNLTDDQYSRLQEEIENFYSGSENAGRTFLGEGGMKWQNMSESMRDMDFLNLKKDVRSSIFNTLRIPLPLVMPENMTLANMESARLILYDNAVIPLFMRLMDDLTQFLFPRFKLDPARFRLSFIEQDIPALASRFMNTTERLSKIGAFTINELRAVLGKGEIENGDTVFVPLNVIPLGDDLDTSEQRPEDIAKQRQIFVRLLSAKKDKSGERIYSDNQIEEMAKKYGLGNNTG